MTSGFPKAPGDWLSGYETKKDSRDHSKQKRRMSLSAAPLGTDAPNSSFVFGSDQKEGVIITPGKSKTHAMARNFVFGGFRKGKMPTTPQVEALPDRVNAIRDGSLAAVPPPVGHFVREHRKSDEIPDVDDSESMDVDSTVNLKYRRMPDGRRRSSLDYDEFEAVKQRVAQAAAWALESTQQSLEEGDKDVLELPQAIAGNDDKFAQTHSNRQPEQTPMQLKKWFSSFPRLRVNSK